MSNSSKSNQICPICNRSLLIEKNNCIPFCSLRCQNIDLGNWLSDSYRIPVLSTDEDEFDLEDNEEARYRQIKDPENIN